MAIHWYTAYSADPQLLKILISAIGIDINTIDETLLEYYSKNGFKSLEDLLDKITLPKDNLITKLLEQLKKSSSKIERFAFCDAYYQYLDIISEQGEIIATLNELLNRICSMKTDDVQETLLKTQYSNLVRTFILNAMNLKVVDEKNPDKELEFNRVNTIINGVANMLLQMNAQDIIFMADCNQQMDFPVYDQPKNILIRMIDHFGADKKFIAYILYLIMAVGKVGKIEAHKIFVLDSSNIDVESLQDLIFKLPSKLASSSCGENFNLDELLLRTLLVNIAPELQIVMNKSVGDHGIIPERTTFFEALYAKRVKENN